MSWKGRSRTGFFSCHDGVPVGYKLQESMRLLTYKTLNLEDGYRSPRCLRRALSELLLGASEALPF